MKQVVKYLILTGILLGGAAACGNSGTSKKEGLETHLGNTSSVQSLERNIERPTVEDLLRDPAKYVKVAKNKAEEDSLVKNRYLKYCNDSKTTSKTSKLPKGCFYLPYVSTAY